MVQTKLFQKYIHKTTKSLSRFLKKVSNEIEEMDYTSDEFGFKKFHSLQYLTNARGEITGCIIIFKYRE